jgi:MFS family permease
MTDSRAGGILKTRAPKETGPSQLPGVKPERGFNFGLMVIHQVILRTGWIFKTESIIMPAVLDLMGGQAWLRGCLPMLNRFGQSIPPLLASDKLRNTAVKKYALASTSSVMGACFLVLSVVWMITGGEPSWWLPILFLVIYGVFFASTGINQLVYSTMTGKLISTRKRGLLMLLSTTVGGITAIFFAWVLLNRWLSEQTGNFTNIFAFTGFAFLSAGGLSLLLNEPQDTPTGTKRTGMDLFKMSLATLAVDKNFRRLAIASSLFGMSMTLFPHYQAIGRGKLELGLTAMIPWVIAQNVGASVFSIPAGWAGDRFGNRLVLRVVMLALCLAPVLALFLSRLGPVAQPYFIAVFCLVGLTPVTMRIFSNYTLEIVEPRFHPRYLSTLSLCMAAPAILTSSLLGLLMDWLGFEIVFGLVVALMLWGWLLTFGLDEPRDSHL